MVCLSQVIVIPCGITASLSADERKNVISQCEQFVKEVNAAGIRCRGDFKDNYSPGWKFNHWELKVANSGTESDFGYVGCNNGRGTEAVAELRRKN